MGDKPDLYKYFSTIPYNEFLKDRVSVLAGSEASDSLNDLSNINLFISHNNGGKSYLGRSALRYLANNDNYFYRQYGSLLNLELMQHREKIRELFTKISFFFHPDYEEVNKKILGYPTYITQLSYKDGTFPWREVLGHLKDFLEWIDKPGEDVNIAKFVKDGLIDKLVSEDSIYILAKQNERECLSKRKEIRENFKSNLELYFNLINGFKRNKPKFIYIPNLRTTRFYDHSINQNLTIKTRNEYDLQENNIVIVDGLAICKDFFEMRNSSRDNLNKLARYENVLSKNFFEGRYVHFMTKYEESNQSKELHVQIEGEKERPIHDLGDGIQQIIIMTYPLFFYDQAVIFVEEPELNLHAGLEKKLFDVFNAHSENFMFYLMTHSNHLVDKAVQNDKPIFRIKKLNSKTESGDSKFEITKSVEHYDCLEELGVSASSVLLANGVVWVEGPSDVIYIRKWLELFQRDVKPEKQFKEGLHFTFQVLATALWNHAGFWNPLTKGNIDYTDDEMNNVVNILNVNRNNLLVIDKDTNYDIKKKPSEYDQVSNGVGKNKARLIHKLIQDKENQLNSNTKVYDGETSANTLLFWINKKTIESYLDRFLSVNGKNFQNKFEESGGHWIITDSKVKISIAKDIVMQEGVKFEDFATEDEDLYKKIKALYNTIESWN